MYFGFVDPRTDDHELVKGITVSTTHVDNHYTVGSFQGHDIILVERRNKLTFPGKADTEHRWLILQFDLKQSDFPHIFIDATNHGQDTFYANLFVKFSNFENVSSLFMQSDPAFAHHFKVFTPPDTYDIIKLALPHQITNTLTQHFKHFDYEIFDDRLLVYASDSQVTTPLLTSMLRVGIWLAEHLNSVKPSVR